MFDVLNNGLLTKYTTCLNQVVYTKLPQGSTNIFIIHIGHAMVHLRVLRVFNGPISDMRGTQTSQKLEWVIFDKIIRKMVFLPKTSSVDF